MGNRQLGADGTKTRKRGAWGGVVGRRSQTGRDIDAHTPAESLKTASDNASYQSRSMVSGVTSRVTGGFTGLPEWLTTMLGNTKKLFAWTVGAEDWSSEPSSSA